MRTVPAPSGHRTLVRRSVTAETWPRDDTATPRVRAAQQDSPGHHTLRGPPHRVGARDHAPAALGVGKGEVHGPVDAIGLQRLGKIDVDGVAVDPEADGLLADQSGAPLTLVQPLAQRPLISITDPVPVRVPRINPGASSRRRCQV